MSIVFGRVVNIQQIPVAGASITIDNDYITFSDANGNFRFDESITGKHILKVIFKSYEVFMTNILVSVDLNVDVVLTNKIYTSSTSESSELESVRYNVEIPLLRRSGIEGICTNDVGNNIVIFTSNPDYIKSTIPSTISGCRVTFSKMGKMQALGAFKVPYTFGGYARTGWFPCKLCMTEQASASCNPEALKFNNPVIGGTSCIGYRIVGGYGNYVDAGTISCVVRDKSTGKMSILSNNHVIAGNWNDRTLSSVGTDVMQPGTLETLYPPKIANLTKWSNINYTRENRVDGAVAELKLKYAPARGPAVNNLYYKYGVLGIGEITSVNTGSIINKTVKFAGRTSGVSSGIVISENASVKITYGVRECLFTNQIIIVLDPGNPPKTGGGYGCPGDSGSLLLDENNSAVGLIFAGTGSVEDNTVDDTPGAPSYLGIAMVANKIDDVQKELNIQVMTGAGEGPGTVIPPGPSTSKGFLGVTTNVASAKVYVDGKLVGTVLKYPKYLKVEVLTGSHVVAVKATGYADISQTVTISKGITTVVNANFKTTSGVGNVKVTVSPATLPMSDVYVDNIKQGSTKASLLIKSITVGQHIVTVKKSGYKDKSVNVNVQDKKTTVVNVVMVKSASTSRKIYGNVRIKTFDKNTKKSIQTPILTKIMNRMTSEYTEVNSACNNKSFRLEVGKYNLIISNGGNVKTIVASIQAGKTIVKNVYF